MKTNKNMYETLPEYIQYKAKSIAKIVHHNKNFFLGVLCWIIYFFHCKNLVIQKKWGRKLFKGRYYKITDSGYQIPHWVHYKPPVLDLTVHKAEEYPRKQKI